MKVNVKVLFDADIVLDILLKRPQFATSALALAHTPEPWLSSLSLANICYITGRSQRPRIDPQLRFLTGKFRLAAITEACVTRAMELDLTDFEDCLQLAAAEASQIPYLATRNLSDYTSTKHVSVISTADLLDLLEVG